MRSALDAVRSVASKALASTRLRPNFLIIGAQKSGTTALHGYLSEHPAVILARRKELHYFNNAYGRDNPYGRADRWYLSYFPLTIQGVLARRQLGVEPPVGEATPAYLFHPRVPERVHTFDPRMKLIAVLRDPVERAYSQYQMQVRSGQHTLSFEEALEREEPYLRVELQRIRDDPLYVSQTDLVYSYVARGKYAEQIERWLQHFPQEQLLVLAAEELLGDPDGEMTKVCRFLGIPDDSGQAFPLQRVNSYAPMRPDTRERLAHEFAPQNRRLEELLGRRLHWTTAGT